MDGQLKNSLQVGYPFDSDDLKYISGLSTILVATIEEAKDRISQIEYIFCNQLYSNFQTKCKSLQKIYSEAKNTAEDTYKEKENELVLRIEQIQLEKEKVLEENRSLKLEKVKWSKEAELLDTKLKNQQSLIDTLKEELMHKSMKIDQGIELHNKLLQSIQSKDSVIGNKGKQLKEQEQKTNAVFEKLKSLETRVGELQKERVEKDENMAKERSVNQNLFKKIEMQASEILNYEQLLDIHGKEKSLLVAKLKHLEGNMGKLQEEVRRKSHEAPKGNDSGELQRQLMQERELSDPEKKKNVELLADCEKEKVLLLSKVKALEKKVDELSMSRRQPNRDANEATELNGKLLEQIELKASELLVEKKKRRDTVDAYKRLKSQYNFLCKKFGLTVENMQPQIKSEDLIDSIRDHETPSSRSDLENRGHDNTPVAFGKNKVKAEISSNDDMDDERGENVRRLQCWSSGPDNQVASKIPSDSKSCGSKVKTVISSNDDIDNEKVQGWNCQPPDHDIPVASKSLLNLKSAPVAGVKRRASGWIETRFRLRQVGPDPHGDFLDTPLEEIRGNRNKATGEDRKDNPVLGPKDMDLGSSDDETQDLSAEVQHKEKMPDVNAGKRGFKYVETVRKKAERETLKGVECKQCKKFYDAVIPNNEAGDGNSSNRSFRCEHHDGVSRHRYRYVPPMTPEGFWNIGFESEM